MRDKILEIIKVNQKTDTNYICSNINANKDDILDELNKMYDEKLIGWTKENKVYFIGTKYLLGSIRLSDRGFGFVKNISDLEIEDSFVPPINVNGSITSDEVVYTTELEMDGRTKANIEDVSLRTKVFLIGELKRSADKKYLDFVSSEQGFNNYRITMLNKDDFKLKDDLIIKVKIINVRERRLLVRIQKIIGDANKAIDRINSIAYEFDIPIDFNHATTQNAEKVALPIDYKDIQVSRRKKIIKDKTLVTIDGADSKDLDDAIYVERTDDGYKLLVAIADVSYYVTPKSPLDNTALYRGNSVYLANKVIPMLPKILSNGVCSLNPDEEKLCLVCEINFDDSGLVKSKTVFESIMESKARLTYSEVNELYSGQTIKRDKKVIDMLLIAKELHEKIELVKDKKGTIEFDIPEPKIVLDSDSNVIDIVQRDRGISEKLIENFMVSANEAVASLIFKKELPFVYRNHARPKEEKLIEWYSILTTLGINPKITEAQKQDPKFIRKTLSQIEEQIKDKTERDVINVTLLKFMEKAAYELENIGHFGLASDCYSHFTSPIRRYSDLMVHRYLKQYLIEKDIRDFRIEQNTTFINKASTIINETEKKGVSCEREVNKICMAEYLQKYIGSEYDGIVAAVLKFGLFVQLGNCVEGLIHISELPGFKFDEKTNILVNDQNKVFRLGQKIKIRVKNADVKKRMIDFVLA